MLNITRKEYLLLSEREQKVVKKLGLYTSPSKKLDLDAYILITKTTCDLCKSSRTNIFLMEKQEGYLQSEKISHVPLNSSLKKKNAYYTTRHCNHCNRYLNTLSKEHVIEKFLFYLKNSLI